MIMIFPQGVYSFRSQILPRTRFRFFENLPAKDTGCGFPGRYRLFWRSTQSMLHVPHLFI